MYRLDDLLHLMARLRDPEFGCPWDLKQSYATIVPHTLEEAYEVADAIEQGDFPQLREELGDLLFVVVNLARHLKVDPEAALRQANGKFERRFRFIERNLREAGRKAEECSLEELDSLWGEAKKAERSAPGC